MTQIEGCQIPCLPRLAEGPAQVGPQPLTRRLKRALARPWNYQLKPQLKRFFAWREARQAARGKVAAVAQAASAPPRPLQAGDRVRVKSRPEIQATLNRWKELKGCAFLEEMGQYCGTEQVVLQPLERFLDERDYKVKKARGLVLLQGVICRGTPVFGRCDRACHLFWREEWLELLEPERNPALSP